MDSNALHCNYITVVAENTCWPAGKKTISLEIAFTGLFIVWYTLSRMDAFDSLLVGSYFTRYYCFTVVDWLYDWSISIRFGTCVPKSTGAAFCDYLFQPA